MKPTFLLPLLSLYSVFLFAQRPKYEWQLEAGLNIIDLYPVGTSSAYFPNQGGYFENIGNTDHWNYGVPSLGLFRNIDKNLSAGLHLGFAGITKIAGQQPQNINYFTGNIQIKFAILRNETFSPFTRLGIGFSTFNNDASEVNAIEAENRTSTHIASSVGLDIALGDKFGLYIATNFMKGFGTYEISHFVHGVGFSYGLAQNDQDGDGVPDAKDNCIRTAGLQDFDGCPDSDNDGIPDPEDDCSELMGFPLLKGCPDTDKDGLVDTSDRCPNEFGLVENQGCPWPDTDGDGRFDHEDDCPTTAGPEENTGCPWPDKDGDGVYDQVDQCPELAGSLDNQGCPLLGEKELNQLYNFDTKLFFMSDSTVLFGAMNEKPIQELVDILAKDTTLRIRIEGHTSSDGDATYNLELSKQRAENVRLRLIEEGISANRLEVKGFGDTRPLFPNKTMMGRSLNRRVEFKLISAQ